MALAAPVPQLVSTGLGQVMWLPYESFAAQTGESPEEPVRRLRPQVARRRSWIYWLFYDADGFFQGRIDSRGFTLTSIPRVFWTRHYRLAVYGWFHARPPGTAIRVIITMPVLWWAFYVLVWCPIVIFCMVIALQTATGSAGNLASVLAFLLLVLVWPLVVSAVIFWVLEPRYREEAQRLLGGE